MEARENSCRTPRFRRKGSSSRPRIQLGSDNIHMPLGPKAHHTERPETKERLVACSVAANLTVRILKEKSHRTSKPADLESLRGTPPASTVPCVGLNRPFIHNVLDLPAPFVPTCVTNPPRPMRNPHRSKPTARRHGTHGHRRIRCWEARDIETGRGRLSGERPNGRLEPDRRLDSVGRPEPPARPDALSTSACPTSSRINSVHRSLSRYLVHPATYRARVQPGRA